MAIIGRDKKGTTYNYLKNKVLIIVIFILSQILLGEKILTPSKL